MRSSMPSATPLRLMLTPGQAHDLAGAEPLLDDIEPQALIGDKAYDADVLIETLVRRTRHRRDSL